MPEAIATVVYYETGPHSEVWPYVRVGFGDIYFKKPISWVFANSLPQGRGPTNYSQIPIEVVEAFLDVDQPDLDLLTLTDEDRTIGERFIVVLAALREVGPTSPRALRDALGERGAHFTYGQLVRISSKLVESNLALREGGRRIKGRYILVTYRLSEKGLNLLRENNDWLLST